MVHHVGRPSADADHPTVLDGNVTSASGAAQHACGLHPGVHVSVTQPVGEKLVDPSWPRLTSSEWGSRSPDVGDPVRHVHLRYSVPWAMSYP